jgi:chromosome segregation and condensation protein ScpB
MKKSKIIKELEKTCPRDERGHLDISKVSNLEDLYIKMGFSPFISQETPVQNEPLSKDKQEQ